MVCRSPIDYVSLPTQIKGVNLWYAHSKKIQIVPLTPLYSRCRAQSRHFDTLILHLRIALLWTTCEQRSTRTWTNEGISTSTTREVGSTQSRSYVSILNCFVTTSLVILTRSVPPPRP